MNAVSRYLVRAAKTSASHSLQEEQAGLKPQVSQERDVAYVHLKIIYLKTLFRILLQQKHIP